MNYPNVKQSISILGKIANAPIGNTKPPQGTKRIFPVAVTSMGQILLSNGETRETPILGKLAELNKKEALNGQLNPAVSRPEDYTQNLSLNIAVPAQQTGADYASNGNALVQYLNQILQPRLAAAPEAGLPALVPQMVDKNATNQMTSSFVGLPQMVKPPENMWGKELNQNNSVLSNLLANFDKILNNSIGAQFNPGETETGSLNRYSLPLVQGYGNSYRLPTQANAPYAQISANPFVLTGLVR